jgi:NitT/TauT family transport system ATP-binding protein
MEAANDDTLIRIDRVSKEFKGLSGETYTALHEVSIDVRKGDFYCLLGPSGCGKSTILNLVAGFEKPTRGRIQISKAVQARPDPEPGTDRIMIFQESSAALFPWLNVEENILFGPKLVGIVRSEYQSRLQIYLRMVGLSRHAQKFPFELSGGMKQRVQIARSLIMEPEVLLMDEPFAALDAISKRSLQRQLSRIWQETHKTVMYVTHDIIEALLLGTRIAVMSASPSSRIKREIRVDLPRPRMLGSMEFVEAARLLESLIEEEMLDPAAATPD